MDLTYVFYAEGFTPNSAEEGITKFSGYLAITQRSKEGFEVLNRWRKVESDFLSIRLCSSAFFFDMSSSSIEDGSGMSAPISRWVTWGINAGTI